MYNVQCTLERKIGLKYLKLRYDSIPQQYFNIRIFLSLLSEIDEANFLNLLLCKTLCSSNSCSFF